MTVPVAFVLLFFRTFFFYFSVYAVVGDWLIVLFTDINVLLPRSNSSVPADALLEQVTVAPYSTVVRASIATAFSVNVYRVLFV